MFQSIIHKIIINMLY